MLPPFLFQIIRIREHKNRALFLFRGNNTIKNDVVTSFHLSFPPIGWVARFVFAEKQAELRFKIRILFDK
jgi:hypothetical protein